MLMQLHGRGDMLPVLGPAWSPRHHARPGEGQVYQCTMHSFLPSICDSGWTGVLSFHHGRPLSSNNLRKRSETVAFVMVCQSKKRSPPPMRLSSVMSGEGMCCSKSWTRSASRMGTHSSWLDSLRPRASAATFMDREKRARLAQAIFSSRSYGDTHSGAQPWENCTGNSAFAGYSWNLHSRATLWDDRWRPVKAFQLRRLKMIHDGILSHTDILGNDVKMRPKKDR